jgi:putative ABC transport system substrate-binding protein
MKIIAYLFAACSVLVGAPDALRAQVPDKVPRIGILASTSGPGGVDDGIFQGLHDLGYTDQRNIALHVRWSAGRQELYPKLATELINLSVDVIVASGPRCEAVFALTKTIPIVCPNLNDPLTKGLIASFNRPGGNVTGFLLLSPELFHKRFQILKEAIPRVQRVSVLWRTENHALLEWSKTAGRLNSFEIDATRIDRADDIDRAFAAARRNRLDAVVTTQGPLFDIEGGRIAQLGLKYSLPTMTGETGFATLGGFLQFGPDIADNWRHAARYVDKILKGEKAGDLPIEQPSPKLVLNLKTAKTLGLTVPTSILLRADQVIE